MAKQKRKQLLGLVRNLFLENIFMIKALPIRPISIKHDVNMMLIFLVASST